MNANNTHAYAYKETKLKTSSQGQIIVMLYDAAIRNMDAAVTDMEAGTRKLDSVNASLLKAKDIITELTCSLDLENGGAFAERMFALYMWFNEQLLEANVKKDSEPIKLVRGMMDELRGAWAQIAENTHVEGKAVTGVNLAG